MRGGGTKLPRNKLFATEHAQVSHKSITRQECMEWTSACSRYADDLRALIHAERYCVAAS
jgi:hypothetical protein